MNEGTVVPAQPTNSVANTLVLNQFREDHRLLMSGRMRRAVEAALGIAHIEEDGDETEESSSSSSSSGELGGMCVCVCFFGRGWGRGDGEGWDLLVCVHVNGGIDSSFRPSVRPLQTIGQTPPTEDEGGGDDDAGQEAEKEKEEEKRRMEALVASLGRMGFSEKQGRHAVRAVERR